MSGPAQTTSKTWSLEFLLGQLSLTKMHVRQACSHNKKETQCDTV